MPELPMGTGRDDAAIAGAIGRWFQSNARTLPWRTTPRDPWLSLMSEIMLQQTQAARVAERFPSFVHAFPTPEAMAKRAVDDVLALWSGLGYYRRARMLHACATAIARQHGGKLPREAAVLRDLPGVGRYTAGAVASIAFGSREPIVDGNVSRVLLRIHGVHRSADEKDVAAWAWKRAADLVDAAADPAGYSEGIMELGATVCTPKLPACGRCPLRRRCEALQAGMVDRIPQAKARPNRTPLAITAVVISDRHGRVLLEQRPEAGLWSGLWQPPCLEADAKRPPSRSTTLNALGLRGVVETSGRSCTFPFATTHREVHVRVWSALAEDPRAILAALLAAGRPRAGWYVTNQLDTLALGAVQKKMLACVGVGSPANRGPIS